MPSAGFGWVEGVPAYRGGPASVAVDASNNIYEAGGYGGTTNFDPSGLSTSSTLTSAGDADVFVAKYSSTGAFQWVTGMGGTQADIAERVTVFNDSPTHAMIYVAGFFTGSTATFGSFTLTGNSNSQNGFMAKLDGGTGNVLWAKSVAGTDGRGVAVDSSGNAYVTFATDFGNDGDASDSYTPNVSGSSANIIKFAAADGSQLWNYKITPPRGGGVDAFGVVVAGSDVYATGRFQGNNVNFNPAGHAKVTANSPSGYDLTLTTNGTFVRVTPFGNTSNSYTNPYAIAVDGAGNVYTYGTFEGTAAFDSTHTLNAGSGATFLTKLNQNGQLQWVDQLGSGGDVASSLFSGGLALDASNNVYATGRFTGSVLFGATTLTSQPNAKNIFVTEIDGTSDVFDWAVAAGGPIDDRGNGVAVDSSGNVDVTGSIDRTYVSSYVADFDGGQLSVDTKTSFFWQLTQSPLTANMLLTPAASPLAMNQPPVAAVIPSLASRDAAFISMAQEPLLRAGVLRSVGSGTPVVDSLAPVADLAWTTAGVYGGANPPNSLTILAPSSSQAVHTDGSAMGLRGGALTSEDSARSADAADIFSAGLASDAAAEG
ncbi:MAG TPA: hypothetical protein VE999_02400 [Gemmataceae bacterium]|nr:hypothetical protein [Gemmataceae bacterium]